MLDSTIAAKHPCQVKLDAGQTYYWCACGLSATQPLCDGSHRVTALRPLAFQVQQSTDAWLCQCKRSQRPPYCDGTHKTL